MVREPLMMKMPYSNWWVNSWGQFCNKGISHVRQGLINREKAIVTNQFVALAIAITFAYIIFYLIYDPIYTAPLLFISAVAILAYLIILFLNHKGFGFIASLLALIVPCIQLATVSYLLSSRAGVHSYLLCGGVLSFLMFTDKTAIE